MEVDKRYPLRDGARQRRRQCLDGAVVAGALFPPGVRLWLHDQSQGLRRFCLARDAHLAKWLDHSFYHLDGEGAICHLPTLFDLKELDGIQWTYGAAHDNTPAVHWIPLYQRIQKAGKLVHISCKYGEVEPLLTNLDPRGIILVTSAPSVQAADALLENAKRWSRRGIHAVS